MPEPSEVPIARNDNDLDPASDPRDSVVGPSWDKDHQILTYWFPDMWRAIFHSQVPDPRWELRNPSGIDVAWFKTYEHLICYRQDRRATEKQ